MFFGIRFKLSFITFLLVTITTVVSSLIVMSIMDTFLLGELVKRGGAVSRSVANTAGYSIMSGDRLALDNLVAQLKEQQYDISSVAIMTRRGKITAHSDLTKNGTRFAPAAGGTLIEKQADGSRVFRVVRDGQVSFEFLTPIVFARHRVGSLYLVIDAASLATAQHAAKRKVLLASGVILLLAMVGAIFVTNAFTTPLKKLTASVAQLSSGRFLGALRVTSRDEIGELTGNFNEMAQVIFRQRQKLEEYARGLEDSYLATVKILATSIDARDDYTLQHSTRVAALALLVGRKLGLDPDELQELEVAALVHDLGKIRVPDHILQKSTPLNAEEYLLVKRHPQDGAEILRHSQSLHKFIPTVLHHHEWHNGQGYPAGLQGGEIPLFASIIAIADAFDAMTIARPYRRALPFKTAIEEIVRHAGTQFDPSLAECFVAAVADWPGDQIPPGHGGVA